MPACQKRTTVMRSLKHIVELRRLQEKTYAARNSEGDKSGVSAHRGPRGCASRGTESGRRSDSSETTKRIAADQMWLLYAQAPTTQVVTLLNAALVPVVFRGQVAQSVLLGWFGLMAAVTLTHVILIHQHYRAVPTANQLRRLRTRFLVGVSCAGLAWGSTSIVLLPLDSRVYQL